MKAISIFVLMVFLISCGQDDQVEEPRQFVNIPSIMRGFINQPGSYWIYKGQGGYIDTVTLTKVDSSIVTFNYYSPTDFIDVKICELHFDSPYYFHTYFVLKSSLISDSYDKWGIPHGMLRYVGLNSFVNVGDTICGFDNCIYILESYDSLNIEGNFYHDVVKFSTDQGITLFWDPKVGLVQYEKFSKTWKLLDYKLIK